MPIRKVEVQRFSLTTSRPFEAVVAALKAGVGQLDLTAFARASKSPGQLLFPYENQDALRVAQELDSKVEKLLNDAAVG